MLTSICSAVALSLIAEGHEVLRCFAELIRLLEYAADLTRQVDAGWNAKTEVADILVEHTVIKSLRKRREDDVATDCSSAMRNVVLPSAWSSTDGMTRNAHGSTESVDLFFGCYETLDPGGRQR